MYSTNNERKSVVAKRFIRTLKNKIYKYMASISKNVYIDKLDDIMDEYNNTYHKTIKMKPIDVKDNTYINNTDKKVNDKDLKFKIGDHVRISKYKNVFAKGYTPNWFVGRNYFEGDDGAQNTLVFQVKSIFFKLIALGNRKYNTWTSKGISHQCLYFANGDITTKLIRPSHFVLGANDYFFQDSANVINNRNIVNVYITYKLTPKTINTEFFKKLFI